MSQFEDYKLNEIDKDNSKKHYLDMYMALHRIDEDMDSVGLAAGGVNLDSEFSIYELQDMILDLDLARYFKSYDDWCENSPDPSKLDLLMILSYNNVDYREGDGELIDLIIQNDISLEDWLNEFSYLTDDGKQLLDELSWIEIYDKYMHRFDFDDFYYFISNKSGTIRNNALEYLDEHLLTAEVNNDKQYITQCEASKKLIELLWKNPLEFKKASSEIMEKFERYVQDKRNAERQEEACRKDNSPVQMDEIDFCKMADNKYRLVPREDDSYLMPVRLKQYEYYKSVEEFNDADAALYDLAFVPWCLRYRLRDASFEEGFLTHNACKSNWKDFSKDLKAGQLREFLKKYDMDSSGSKRRLVSRIAESNLPLEEFSSEKTFLSEKAYELFKEYDWIGFYLDVLFSFDFLDYEDYMIEHGGKLEEMTLGYLDEHIKLANEALDFEYVMKCYVAKSKVCHCLENSDEALKCDMRILHLNMNPVCMESYGFSSHIPLVPENISNLKKLKERLGEEKIKEAFNENWNFMGFESYIIPKDEVWDFLITALNSKEQNYGSRRVREKYFINFNNP